MRIFFGMFAAFVLVLVPARGDAQTVASEIKAYNNVTVTFSKNADSCNLSDDTIFKQRMREKLAGAGVRQSDTSRVIANLAVSANGFGPLKVNCMFSTKLNFLVKLRADNIVTDDPAARRAIDRLGAVDVIIYSNGFFGTQNQRQPAAGGESTTVRDRVLEIIDLSVNKLVADRAR
jgi:hypothetical protein